MAHVEATNSVLHALKTLGVQLAIDDFGTGWSSLSYLRHFPIDALKVDKSFVQEITSGSSAAPIVSAVISMGKSLKHRVIAEGVETRDQLAFLQAEDCDEGQGYYFSRPLVAQQFARVLEPARPRLDDRRPRGESSRANDGSREAAYAMAVNSRMRRDAVHREGSDRCPVQHKRPKESWPCSMPAMTRLTWSRSSDRVGRRPDPDLVSLRGPEEGHRRFRQVHGQTQPGGRDLRSLAAVR